MRTAIDRLTALDRLMLAVDRRWPQDIGALAVLDGTALVDPSGEVRIDAVRAVIASRLHRVPRFRQVVQVPRRGRGGPLWVDAPRFHVREHVLVRPLAPGTDEAGLLAVAEQLRRERLDPASPLWRMWLLPGLLGGRVAMVVQLHHAIADGLAGDEDDLGPRGEPLERTTVRAYSPVSLRSHADSGPLQGNLIAEIGRLARDARVGRVAPHRRGDRQEEGEGPDVARGADPRQAHAEAHAGGGDAPARQRARPRPDRTTREE
jgi:hypothetical protein